MFTTTLDSAKYFSDSQQVVTPADLHRQATYRIGGWLAAIAGVGFITTTFVLQGDYVAAAALLLISYGAFMGFLQGFVSVVVALVAAVVVLQLAFPLGVSFEAGVSEKLGTTGLLNRGVAVVVTGSLVYLGFNMLVSTIVAIVLGGREKPALICRLMGSLLGAAQWTFVVAFVLGSWLTLEPTLQQIDSEAIPAPLRDQIASTSVRPLLEKYNPIVMIQDLELERIENLETTVTTLAATPAMIRQVLYHPSIQEMRKDPKFELVYEKVYADPELAQLLRTNQPLGSETKVRLLQNDTLLRLLDQPRFLKTAQKLVVEMSSSTAGTTS